MKIIAESAFNHNGNLEYLKQLASAAYNVGADYFTFQVMNPEMFCVEDYSKYDIYRKNSFSEKEWLELLIIVKC